MSAIKTITTQLEGNAAKLLQNQREAAILQHERDDLLAQLSYHETRLALKQRSENAERRPSMRDYELLPSGGRP